MPDHPVSAVDLPRPAASVILLRDSAEGLQTLLLHRNTQLVNMAGIYVFPGGKLEYADSAADSLALLDQSPELLHQQLGEPATDQAMAVGLYVAALREVLEECGMLLIPPACTPTAPEQARCLLNEGLGFSQALSRLGLRLATQQLTPWSRWITPKVPAVATRRFDARFFAALAPADQTATHDNQEATDSLWIHPRAALERYRDGTMDLAPPQIMTLAELARHQTAAQALDAAQRRRPPTIEPHTLPGEGHTVHCYPGDPLHPIPTRALPGPTRLLMRQRRFLPEAGFEAFFSDR